MDAPSLFDAALAPRSDLAELVPTPSPAGGGAGGTRPERAPASQRPQPPSRPAAPRRPVLLAVDGNALAHRAFHAYGPGDLAGTAPDERGALRGFLALLAAVCDRTSPERIVVGFDCRAGSHRRTRHAAYKANRPAKDPALYALLDLAAAVLEDCGVHVVVPAGWEADDILASAASAAAARGWACVAATSDRDAFALVDDTTTVLRLRTGMDNAEAVDPAWIRRRLRIEPTQYLDFAALRGDPSDNLPGVPGIGPSRAAALLRAYASVAAAVADPLGCRSVLGPQLGQVLLDDVASAESVFARNRALMTLQRDLDVDVAACGRTAPPRAIEETCRAWGLVGLAGRLAVAVGARPEAAAPLPAAPPA